MAQRTQAARFQTLGVSAWPRNGVIEKVVGRIPQRFLLSARVIGHRIRNMEKVLKKLGRDIYFFFFAQAYKNGIC